MKALEHCILRIADSDWTWTGFNWMRPAKHQRIGFGYIAFSSVLLGLPGVAAGAALIYGFLGRIEPRVWLGMFALVLLVEVPLHLLFAHYWNRRATTFRSRNNSTGGPASPTNE